MASLTCHKRDFLTTLRRTCLKQNVFAYSPSYNESQEKKIVVMTKYDRKYLGLKGTCIQVRIILVFVIFSVCFRYCRPSVVASI